MAETTVIPTLAEVADFIGVELGPSDWVSISQDRINDFAKATGDHQWIHTDVERARRESPWKETIAHGYLTLSLAPMLLGEILDIQESRSAINSGIEKMRLSSPVLAGSRVRLSGSIHHVRSLPGAGLRVVIRMVFELEGASKPACTANVVYVYYP
jgi:acyl dehydratase